jgi:hypothetical protein
MKYWEIIADNLKQAGWSLGWVSALDCEGRTIWIVDAHRDNGKRFIARSDEKLTEFLELERAICLHLLTEQLREMKMTRPGSLVSSSGIINGCCPQKRLVISIE